MNKHKKARNDAELDVETWISYAENTYLSALRASRQPIISIPTAGEICFHCQQSVEKILKAYVIAKENYFDYTHDLESLVTRSQQYLPNIAKYSEACTRLEKYKTIRYPPSSGMDEVPLDEIAVENALKDASGIFVFASSELKEMGFTAFDATAKFGAMSTGEEIEKYMYYNHAIKISSNVSELITKNVAGGEMTPPEICRSLEEQLIVAGNILRWEIEEHNRIIEKATLKNDFVVTIDHETKKYFLRRLSENRAPTLENSFGEARSIAGEYAINNFLEHAIPRFA